MSLWHIYMATTLTTEYLMHLTAKLQWTTKWYTEITRSCEVVISYEGYRI